MIDGQINNDWHISATTVPDVMAVDDVAVSTGASIVVAVAATIAVVLTLLVASLSSASAAPLAAGIERSVASTAFVNPVAVSYQSAAPRDQTYIVAMNDRSRRESLAGWLLGAAFVGSLAATVQSWRGLSRAPKPCRREIARKG